VVVVGVVVVLVVVGRKKGAGADIFDDKAE